MKKIYLDYAASTPCVWRALIKGIKYSLFSFGNPLSAHAYGKTAFQAIELSRQQLSKDIKANIEEVYFCGSGTESINLAIAGSANANWGRGKHIITSAVEHHAVLNVLENLESHGFEVTYLPVNELGLVDLNDVKKFMRPDTILVSIMMANNETGAVQPIKEIVKIVKEINSNCLVHTDACQAGNWFDINVQDLGVDLLSLDSSKVYGPKGVGALYVKNNTPIYPIIFGGTQEKNLRAGTHNVGGIVSFAEAFRISRKRLAKDYEKNLQLKKWLIDELRKISGVSLNSSIDNSLPHIINFSIQDKNAGETIAWFDARGICLSAGAACTTGNLKPSHVILAQTGVIGLAQSAIRVSLGRKSKLGELKKFVSLLQKYIETKN